MGSVWTIGMTSTSSRNRMEKRKLYIIHSEYIQHRLTFNCRDRYTDNPEKVDQIYEETLLAMKVDNQDKLDDGDNYEIHKSNKVGSKYFYCFYKYQPLVSNFSLEMKTAELE